MNRLLTSLAALSTIWLNIAYSQSINETKLTASDGATGDVFGSSVSINGEFGIIGARMFSNGGNGAAYVFKRVKEDWTEQAKLTASDGARADQFGQAVSIAKDYAIVGARMFFNGGNGAAYIFKREGENWVEQAKLTASDGAEDDQFGWSVSISGDYAIVGAWFDDDNGSASGSAYVFKREGTNWTQQSKLTSSDGAERDYFGSSVSICGKYAVIGAFLDDDKGTDSGSAYIFKREGTNWIQQTKLTASDGAEGDEFGNSVSLAGDYAIIAAVRDDDKGNASGSVFVFKRNGVNWIEQAKLTASDGASTDNFGISVSIAGNYAVIGAHLNDDPGNNSGSAYIFKRDGTSWVELIKLTASDSDSSELFGFSVSIDSNYALIGAQWDDDNGGHSGSAYSYNDFSTVVGIDHIISDIPRDFLLEQNYPNPFNPSTTIRFAIPKAAKVTLKIYDILGREIETLVSTKLNPGEYEVEWGARGLASGVYVYQLQAGDFVQSRKLLLLK